MLPKSKRLTKADFKGLRTRIVYRGPLFDVAVSSAEVTKFSCIISKKRVRRAVDRNRIKRRIYSLLRTATLTTPLTVIVYPTQHALRASTKTLHEEYVKAFATLR